MLLVVPFQNLLPLCCWCCCSHSHHYCRCWCHAAIIDAANVATIMFGGVLVPFQPPTCFGHPHSVVEAGLEHFCILKYKNAPSQPQQHYIYKLFQPTTSCFNHPPPISTIHHSFQHATRPTTSCLDKQQWLQLQWHLVVG